ncbi:MAG TPA: CUAEP/CCAEP-tail radical SAM protein [Ktedonobacterales bacterium]|nr:CUAEP/CCAEP-tail radical SAM protein [Ktedonobacterales bacterium]
MSERGAILLVSTYELGHQPLSLASPGALLRAAGFSPRLLDLSVVEQQDTDFAEARLVAIAVPMHTALRLGVRVEQRVRAVNPTATICFYGLYASLNAEYLLRTCADAVIGGECEAALVALAQSLAASENGHLPETAIPGVRTRTTFASPVIARIPFAVPDRAGLPPLDRYARLATGSDTTPAGYVEASRGCLHTCAHCPITPIYGGRFFVVPRDIVLADIRAQVAAGATHITFGDPDFLNGPGHSLAIVRAMRAEFPTITFDATIKIEHIIERRQVFAELRELGCAFVVSAVESLSANVLRHLRKGHSRQDVIEALRVLEEADIPMRPTLVAFTPWTTARDYMDVLDFVAEQGLVEHVAPVQYTIRLLVPPGSALLEADDTAGWLGALDEENFTYRWRHPDPRMDALQIELAALVEEQTARDASNAEVFAAIRARAARTLAMAPSAAFAGAASDEAPMRRPVPHLTEAWFC